MDEADVVMPITRIADYLDFIKQLSHQHQVRIRTFGHAGDGNLHVYVCKDDIEEARWTELLPKVMDALYARALEEKGAVSGEHGIGHAKKAYLEASVGKTQIALMRSIKEVFDPQWILNPDKIIDLK
jgi:glycolate oxidase